MVDVASEHSSLDNENGLESEHTGYLARNLDLRGREGGVERG